MKKLSRRKFLINNSIAVAGAPFLLSATNARNSVSETASRVQFTRDGLDLNPQEYSELLTEITKKENIVDNYSQFGVVEALENKFSDLLGMESSIFMPTGTLANSIALRKLAGDNKRVLVQSASHIYNDSGDCAQILSGLNLIHLAEGKSSFTLEDVKIAIDKTNQGRVKTGVGVISIESPVRRLNNEMFDFGEMKAISEYARANGIKLHLDGARLFNVVAHSAIPVKEFASLFDTVYISLYKDFNAASGAMLSGTSEFTKDLYHTRRMFGGGLPQVWPFAAVALHYADSFLPDYSEALKRFGKFSQILNSTSRFKVETIENGSNVFRMEVRCSDTTQFKLSLLKQNVDLPEPAGEGLFFPKTNNTLLRVDPETLAQKFINALN
jgi:threonine aldolase